MLQAHRKKCNLSYKIQLNKYLALKVPLQSLRTMRWFCLQTSRKYVTGLQRYQHHELNYVRGTFMFVLNPYGVCPQMLIWTKFCGSVPSPVGGLSSFSWLLYLRIGFVEPWQRAMNLNSAISSSRNGTYTVTTCAFFLHCSIYCKNYIPLNSRMVSSEAKSCSVKETGIIRTSLCQGSQCETEIQTK